MPENSIFHHAVPDFLNKLNSLPESIPGITGYPANYLANLRQHSGYYIRMYADLLSKATNLATLPPEFGLLDVGCGNGLLGIFAKFCGVQNVVLLDPDKQFMDAAKILAQSLEIPINEFITGEVSDIHHVKQIPQIDLVAGTDMIEHVYKLDTFLKHLASLNAKLTVVFSSAANPENPFTRWKMQRQQIKDELIGDTSMDAENSGKTVMPFLQIRKSIINIHFPHYSEDKINKLAMATRGLQQNDIVEAVKHFEINGKIPLPAKGKNTCNPVTGSWTERLCSLSWYQKIFKENEFQPSFFCGFYNQWQPGYRGFVKKMLNRIRWLFGLKFSPYFIIIGNKK